jgi:hypothetical protein
MLENSLKLRTWKSLKIKKRHVRLERYYTHFMTFVFRQLRRE